MVNTDKGEKFIPEETRNLNKTDKQDQERYEYIGDIKISNKNVKTILDTAVHKSISGLEYFILSCNDRFIEMKYMPGLREFKTEIIPMEESKLREEAKKNILQGIEHPTTHLYKAAYEIMKKTATEEGEAVAYRLETENENMKTWAEEVGQNIFNWEDIKYKDRGSAFSTSIKPTQNTH